MSATRPILWFEVGDLLDHFHYVATATGIQRVTHEILLAAVRSPDAAPRVRFCRLVTSTGCFESVSWQVVSAALATPLGRFGSAELWAGIDWRRAPGRALGQVLRTLPRYLFWVIAHVASLVGERLRCGRRERRFVAEMAPGDIVVALGGPWRHVRYGALIARLKRVSGARFALLIHDLMTLVDPDVVAASVGPRFIAWFEEALPVCDALFTVSASTRRDLLAYGARRGWALPPVDVLRLGSGFQVAAGTAPARATGLPDRFVLYVSTVEARKNHRLLVQVWRRLVERHGAPAVPSLVFVGRVGWKVEALLAALAASDFLGGKIALHQDFSDAEVNDAYRRCLFTVYPSRYEGWGLPVAESLAHGKFCVASNAASLPEVGGDWVDYFDPADEDQALAVIERVLVEPGYLAARQARIRASYRPPTWDDCLAALLAALDGGATAESPSPRRDEP